MRIRYLVNPGSGIENVGSGINNKHPGSASGLNLTVDSGQFGRMKASIPSFFLPATALKLLPAHDDGVITLFNGDAHCTVGYSDYDVFLENDEGSRVYRCKKLF